MTIPQSHIALSEALKNARYAPQVELAPIPKGFGQIVGCGLDWWQESWDVKCHPHLWDMLTAKKAEAIAKDPTRETLIEVWLGGLAWQLEPSGRKGKEFILKNDQFEIAIGTQSPKMTHTLSIKVECAYLWSNDIHDIRREMDEIISLADFKRMQKDYKRLSRADYCFDIESEAFTPQMKSKITETVVCPKEVKTRGDFVIQTNALQTLTIGGLTSCQVQIYDKTQELADKPGKEWLYSIWANGGWSGELQHVWRLEIRMPKEWLKPRGCNDPALFLDKIDNLLSEALYNRRLTKPKRSDSNRRRWPLHPLYGLALTEIDNPRRFQPIDKRATLRGDQLQEILKANIAGSLRSLVVLTGVCDYSMNDTEGRRLMQFDEDLLAALANDVILRLNGDPEHFEKTRRAIERYLYVDSPQR